MTRNEWRDHYGLDEGEMVELENYLKTNDCKILSIRESGKWDNIGFRDRKVDWLI